MPFTPYHFGPSGFVGLLCRRWLDVPVFVAANILIDIEVIADSGFPWYPDGQSPGWWFNGFSPGWPVHQIWHFHTLLIGGLVGAVFGLLIYYIKPFRWCCEKSMSLIGLPGRPTLLSMVLAGLLGACLHVIIDSFYHYDVQIFWPHKDNTVFRWISGGKWSNMAKTQQQVLLWCRIFWGLMFGLYGLLLSFKAKKREKKPESTQI
ncbi:MAG: hypothetical protein ACO21J_04350 [Anaerohalosphaeraceae bacterium]|jgi:hypothetical protein